MTKYVIEILKEINDDLLLINNHKANNALRFVFEFAFDPAKKFLLPEGTPPFKPETAPLGMTPTNFNQETRRFYIFCRSDLKPFLRETRFVQMLEGIHPSEAELMIAIKDQNLESLFPNITFDAVSASGYIPDVQMSNKKAAVVQADKSVLEPEVRRGRGRPFGSLGPAKKVIQETV